MPHINPFARSTPKPTPTKNPSPSPITTQIPSPAALLQQWGFPDPQRTPEALCDHAQLVTELFNQPIGNIITHLKLADPAHIEKLLPLKPQNLLTLEYLSNEIPSLLPKNPQILAISRHLPFFNSLEPFFPQITSLASSTPPDALAHLERLNAILFTSPVSPSHYILAFSNISNLIEFSTNPVAHTENSPLHLFLNSKTLTTALCPASASAAAFAALSKENNPHTIMEASSQDNFWAASHAITDAERTLARLLDDALSRRATDIAIAPQRDGTAIVKMRIFGDMTPPTRFATLNPELNKEITNFLLTKSRASTGIRLRQPADGQITYKGSTTETFIRCSFIPADHFGLDFDLISSSLRLMPKTARSIDLAHLNIHAKTTHAIRDALLKSQGLIVLAGPTNSGKSTTIAGVVNEHVKLYGHSKKRLSLEDPVERYIDGITQFSVSNNFADLMRALLRHDPDLIWVGELRDPDSAITCVRASTSGHIVISTVHANNTVLAFRAIANYLRKSASSTSNSSGASIFDLSESLSLIIGQRLVKHLCPHCKQPHHLSQVETHQITSYLASEGLAHTTQKTLHALKNTTLFKPNPAGCNHCHLLGFIGELPINEILPVSRPVRDLFAQSEHGPLDFNKTAEQRTLSLTDSALELIVAGSCDISALFV